MIYQVWESIPRPCPDNIVPGRYLSTFSFLYSMSEYFDFLLPSSHICESLKSQFPPTQLSQALKDYHDKTHYAVMADFRNRYYFIWRDLGWRKIYNTSRNISTTLLNFFATANIYIYGICQSGEENWKMESFFNIAIYLIYKGKTCPHHNGDSDRDSVCFKF